MKHIYTLVLFVGLTSSFLQGQDKGLPVTSIEADYYPNYQYTPENDGVAPGVPIKVMASTDGVWRNLNGQPIPPPQNSLILTKVTTSEVTTSDGITSITTPMEEDGVHRFKAMPANLPKERGSQAYLKGVVSGYGQVFPPTNQEKFSWYITSGKRGLDLATGITNIPPYPPSTEKKISYGAVIVNKDRIEDNIPDIIVTQIANPSNELDKFKLVDENGDKVGDVVEVKFTNINPLGKDRKWNLYDPENGTFASESPRALRMITFKLSDFGINDTNYTEVKQLVYEPSGYSDPAFLAVDEYSMIIFRDECEGEPAEKDPEMAKVGISTLQRGNEEWLSNSGAYIELESSKKGFVITQNANPALNISNPEEGMLVWDTTEKCLKIYNDILGEPQWHCIEKCIKKD
ncbi:hypothetical protein KRX57_05985 [Weeksellaceae bacterium TAE3-ERU29]|nr:hypothetical protein [Weeksellaceae bacterium TAE3-ERU29]